MSKVFDAVDCLYTRPCAEDDYPLNAYVDNLIHRVSMGMFKQQEEICYMISEKNPPMLKDNAIDRMINIIDTEFGWLRHYIVIHMLLTYRASNVDIGLEGEYLLEEEFGDQYDEINQALRKYVYNEYKHFLGEEGANEYFTRIGREDWIIE